MFLILLVLSMWNLVCFCWFVCLFVCFAWNFSERLSSFTYIFFISPQILKLYFTFLSSVRRWQRRSAVSLGEKWRWRVWRNMWRKRVTKCIHVLRTIIVSFLSAELVCYQSDLDSFPRAALRNDFWLCDVLTFGRVDLCFQNQSYQLRH